MIVVTEFFIEYLQESNSFVARTKGGQPVNYMCQIIENMEAANHLNSVCFTPNHGNEELIVFEFLAQIYGLLFCFVFLFWMIVKISNYRFL